MTATNTIGAHYKPTADVWFVRFVCPSFKETLLKIIGQVVRVMVNVK